MLFNSSKYLYLFLPITVLLFYTLFAFSQKARRYQLVFLALASCFFYAYYKASYLILLLGSVFVNYLVSQMMAREASHHKKSLLVLGVLFNVGLLMYFKYTDFFLLNIDRVFSLPKHIPAIALPLAISFYTFQQIAYLVDTSREGFEGYSFSQYLLFVCFFPQLIAGPIVHHKEMMSQFLSPEKTRFCAKNIYLGLLFLVMGLFKKSFADLLAPRVSEIFSSTGALPMLQAWAGGIGYSLQLYFDFSGYCDMAMGAAKMFGIDLPLNFNSPYKSRNIQEFWARWHITLSRWLRDYLYIPLGGNRHGIIRTYINLFLVFLIGGFWHGANWTFLVWGALHGLASVCHRFYGLFKFKMPWFFGWALTMLFVMIAWIFFRADSLAQGWAMVCALVDLQSLDLGEGTGKLYFLMLFVTVVLCVILPNTSQIVQKINRFDDGHKIHRMVACLIGILLALYIFWNQSLPEVQFIYSIF